MHSVVALKVIDRQMAENPAARARFLREARAAAQLHHPNVARVTYYVSKTMNASTSWNSLSWAALAIAIIDEDRHAFNSWPDSFHRALRAAERAFDIDPASLMVNYALAETQCPMRPSIPQPRPPWKI